MAVLDATSRARTVAQMLRERLDFATLAKADIAAALAAADDWVEANAASYNAALPQPFRGAVGAAVKAMLLAIVAMRRAGRYRAEEDG